MFTDDSFQKKGFDAETFEYCPKHPMGKDKSHGWFNTNQCKHCGKVDEFMRAESFSAEMIQYELLVDKTGKGIEEAEIISTHSTLEDAEMAAKEHQTPTWIAETRFVGDTDEVIGSTIIGAESYSAENEYKWYMKCKDVPYEQSTASEDWDSEKPLHDWSNVGEDGFSYCGNCGQYYSPEIGIVSDEKYQDLIHGDAWRAESRGAEDKTHCKNCQLPYDPEIFGIDYQKPDAKYGYCACVMCDGCGDLLTYEDGITDDYGFLCKGCDEGGRNNAESFSAEKFPNKCFICLKDAKNQRPFMEVQSEPSLADKEGNIWLCNHHNNMLDFGLFAKGNILSWTHPNGTKYRQGRLLKMNAENSDMDKKALVESEVSVKMNELFEFVQNHVGAEDGAGGDLYDPNGLDEIENAVSDYFVGYWDFESRHNSNNPRYQNAESFNAELEDCYVCDGMFKQVYVCDNDCGFQCCEIDIDGNLIPVENADGTVNDYCITCYEEKYGAETYGAESSGLTRLPSDEPNFDSQKADRNKDGKISSWERTVGNKVAKGIREGRKTSSKGIDTFAEPFEEIGISKPYARLGVIAAGITAHAFGVNKLRK